MTDNDLLMTAPTTESATAAGGSDDVAAAVATANILIVEHDADCADALQTMLSDLPGVGYVQTTESPDTVLRITSPDNLDAEVSAYAMPWASTPDVIFIDAELRHPELAMVEMLNALRQRVPNAAIVLLCLYPHGLRGKLHAVADHCIRKDTSHRELRALLDDVRGTRHSAFGCMA